MYWTHCLCSQNSCCALSFPAMYMYLFSSKTKPHQSTVTSFFFPEEYSVLLFREFDKDVYLIYIESPLVKWWIWKSISLSGVKFTNSFRFLPGFFCPDKWNYIKQLEKTYMDSHGLLLFSLARFMLALGLWFSGVTLTGTNYTQIRTRPHFWRTQNSQEHIYCKLFQGNLSLSPISVSE